MGIPMVETAAREAPTVPQFSKQLPPLRWMSQWRIKSLHQRKPGYKRSMGRHPMDHGWNCITSKLFDNAITAWIDHTSHASPQHSSARPKIAYKQGNQASLHFVLCSNLHLAWCVSSCKRGERWFWSDFGQGNFFMKAFGTLGPTQSDDHCQPSALY